MSDRKANLKLGRKIEVTHVVVDDCWNTIGIWSGIKDRCERLEEFHHCRNCPVFSKNTQGILDRPVDDGYLHEWQHRLEQTFARRVEQGKLSLFTFRLGDEWFGVETGLIEMVDTMHNYHSIPYVRDEILLGLVNVRGELKVCVSLWKLFGLKRKEAQIGTEKVVVMRDEQHCFAFPVDDVRGTVHYSQTELKDPLKPLLGVDQNMVRGILSQDDQDFVCIEESMLLATIAEHVK